MFAHYFEKQLVITDNVRATGGKTYPVSGKREAKALAKKLNATPWNF